MMAYSANNHGSFLSSPSSGAHLPLPYRSPVLSGCQNKTKWFCLNQNSLQHPNPFVRYIYTLVLKVEDFFISRFQLSGLEKGDVQIYIRWKEENAAWACTGDKCCVMSLSNLCTNQDIMTHEYTHALISRVRPFESSNQSRALNESLGDIFAIIFRHFQELNNHDWKMIDRDVSSKIHMDQYDFDLLDNDHAGVHANSRIPSHAFYLAVKISNTGATGTIADIWFNSMMKNDRDSNKSFYHFALKTISLSYQLDRPEMDVLRTVAAVGQSWVQVGVLKYELNAESTPPDLIELPLPFSKEVGLEKYDFSLVTHANGLYSISAKAFNYIAPSSQSPLTSLFRDRQQPIIPAGWRPTGIIMDIILRSDLGTLSILAPSSLLNTMFYFEKIRRGTIVFKVRRLLVINVGLRNL